MNDLNRKSARVAPVLNLFAKTPIAGKVKTRLIPRLGAERAAKLAEVFVLYTLQQTTRDWPGDRVLWLWPDVEHPMAARVRQQFRIEVRQQSEGDLGDKMMTALTRDLNDDHASAVMGCDLIHVPPCTIADAGQQLGAGHNVFGAAEDGGFWLLGLTQPVPRLFSGIDWQLKDSGSATLSRAASFDIQFGFHAPLMFDIDTPQDLDRLVREHPRIDKYLANVCDFKISETV